MYVYIDIYIYIRIDVCTYRYFQHSPLENVTIACDAARSAALRLKLVPLQGRWQPAGGHALSVEAHACQRLWVPVSLKSQPKSWKTGL